MSGSWSYVVAAWIVVLGSFLAYSVVTVLRGRSLSKQVPSERRRWS